MKNLIVDIGNTRVKLAVMRGSDVLCGATFGDLDGGALEWVSSQDAISRAIISSTRGDAAEFVEFVEFVRSQVDDVVIFDQSTPVPIAVSYATPETLGRDRLAAAVGAWSEYGESADSLLIVDLGSAITIDVVTRDGGFEGGVISPGVAMRFRALHEFTASLPLCEATDEVVELPRSTQDAIQQGVMDGVAMEIDGYIDRANKKTKKNLVIFAGGDAKKLAKRIKNTIFAERELVSLGLNRILEYNAK
ncbi:MAG: type III pantothenate kinase [Rikenellaceae bacterium]